MLYPAVEDMNQVGIGHLRLIAVLNLNLMPSLPQSFGCFENLDAVAAAPAAGVPVVDQKNVHRTSMSEEPVSAQTPYPRWFHAWLTSMLSQGRL